MAARRHVPVATAAPDDASSTCTETLLPPAYATPGMRTRTVSTRSPVARLPHAKDEGEEGGGTAEEEEEDKLIGTDTVVGAVGLRAAVARAQCPDAAPRRGPLAPTSAMLDVELTEPIHRDATVESMASSAVFPTVTFTTVPPALLHAVLTDADVDASDGAIPTSADAIALLKAAAVGTTAVPGTSTTDATSPSAADTPPTVPHDGP